MNWADSLGYSSYKSESLSRVDFSFDYFLPKINFDEDSFVSLSKQDSQYRENGKIQTFNLGRGDVVFRVYDKVAEIKQQSYKVWFYILWGREENVWRIEWQVRKNVLREFGIRTFEDLENQQGDLLRYLAGEHDTLRIPTKDTNGSRYPLHPLWIDLQERISQLNNEGVVGVVGLPAVLDERMMRMAVSVYGYLKRVAAIHCIQHKKEMISNREALEFLSGKIDRIHEPLTWNTDVQNRITKIQLGQW